MELNVELQKTLEGLLQQRDELAVQMHLAKLEAAEEWKKAEDRLDEFKLKLAAASREARDASDDVWTSAQLLGEEVRIAYERIKASFEG